jgi:hypothetical protein
VVPFLTSFAMLVYSISEVMLLPYAAAAAALCCPALQWCFS